MATQTFFIFTPKIGEGVHFDYYFSKGLKPPTRHGFHTGMVSDAATPRMLPCVVCVDSEGVFASPEVQLNQQDLEMDSDDEAQVGES